MSKNVTLWGASYSNVPAINVPQTGGGTARFTDTSPTTAVDADVASGKIYFKADGTQSTGTGSGGGGSSVQTDVVVNSAVTSSSLTFSGLQGEPISFFVMADEDIATGTPAKVASIVYDGTSIHAQTVTNTSNAQASYVNTGLSYTYNNGTLVITSTNPQFVTAEHYMTYAYNGSATNVHTEDVQVGSGATSITFTNLEDEPLVWSCIFKSNFSTSSGYQRVMFTGYDGNLLSGMAMDSSAHSLISWTQSYSNGSLTITSNGTNSGGYFHQPGNYQLTYVVDGDSTLQTKTVTPTEQTQNVTADTGYTALKKVVVNPIPSSYVQPTTTVGATTYRATTTAQTIASGTYHSAQATISAISQTNLTAGNIKSGTTVTISNGQSNIFSVTGTYTGGGGGGSSSIGTTTMTNSSNTATSISFTELSGQPQAFFVRLTTQIARSSSNRYYYVLTVRWDGSTTGGVAGNRFYQYNGTVYNVTSGYSYSYSDNTLTISSNGSQSSGNGSFYNGTYELVYIY